MEDGHIAAAAAAEAVHHMARHSHSAAEFAGNHRVRRSLEEASAGTHWVVRSLQDCHMAAVGWVASKA